MPHGARIVTFFAAAAIIAYYWFRLPPVFGISASDSAVYLQLSGKRLEGGRDSKSLKLAVLIVHVFAPVFPLKLRKNFQAERVFIEITPNVSSFSPISRGSFWSNSNNRADSWTV